jgi:hypothetical protein
MRSGDSEHESPCGDIISCGLSVGISVLAATFRDRKLKQFAAVAFNVGKPALHNHFVTENVRTLQDR